MESGNPSKIGAAAEILAQDQSEHIARAETVRGPARGSSHMTPIRLSAPLLEALDRLAAREGRKRGNLIQTALWEYVRARTTDKRRTPGE
jgi:hypothetical protein